MHEYEGQKWIPMSNFGNDIFDFSLLIDNPKTKKYIWNQNTHKISKRQKEKH